MRRLAIKTLAALLLLYTLSPAAASDDWLQTCVEAEWEYVTTPEEHYEIARAKRRAIHLALDLSHVQVAQCIAVFWAEAVESLESPDS